MDVVQKVRKNIYRGDLLSNGDTVIVGVSGGPDSVALIHVLHALRHQLGLQLHIAHFNHALRKSSNADQNFVERLAKRLNLPCTIASWNNAKSNGKGSLEELAREQRLKFLTRLAKKKSAQAIALAHTDNDLAETVLMRILRGSGLKGIRGILPKREIQRCVFIRPFLGIKRLDIGNYLEKNRISYRIDPTNKQTKFYRNKIRHNLLPLLEKEYNKNTQGVLSKLSNQITIDYDYIELQARKLYNKQVTHSRNYKNIRINLGSLEKQHASMQRMLIRLCIEQLKGDTNRLTLTHIKEIEDLIYNRPAGALVHLPDEISVHKDRDDLILCSK
jgi:tRNA(Ile)-lysidine synthase